MPLPAAPSTTPPPTTPLPEPDVMARRSPGLVRFFGRVMERQMIRSFHRVRIARPGPPPLPAGRPVVIYCNHPSWWDAAFAIVLATRLFPERRSYGPIDAHALARYRFMGRIGLFGVKPDSLAGAAAFLRIGGALLARPDTILWVTAEGRFTDPRARPVRLRPGLAVLLRQVPDALVLPLALEYPFWTERTPEALARFGPPVDLGQDGDTAPDALHTRLERALEATMNALARDAIAKDPAVFNTLLSGTSGVGGIYGLWSRLRALAAGRRFDPDHASVTRHGMRDHADTGHDKEPA